MTMATSNRERIDQGLAAARAGLQPFVDAVMAAGRPAGGTGWRCSTRGTTQRRGTHFSNSRR